MCVCITDVLSNGLRWKIKKKSRHLFTQHINHRTCYGPPRTGLIADDM